MPNYYVRLTVCTNPQEIAEAKAHDEGLKYTVVGDFKTTPLDVTKKVGGPIVDLCYTARVNETPGTNATSPLTLVVSKKDAP